MVCNIRNLFLISFAVACLVVGSVASGAPIENDILEDLKNQLNSLRVKVDFLETKNAKNEEKILNQEEEIIQLKAKFNANQKSEKPSGLSNDITGDSSAPRSVIPSSCRELSLIGHSLDGLYLVKNINTNKIETVYCDFGDSVSQELVGSVDVKTQIVHFYVTRSYTFFTSDAIVTFHDERLNEGSAMNLTSGIFTVPVDGIYHFEFSGAKYYSSDYLFIYLQVNGADIGYALTDPLNNGRYDSLSMSASLRLKANDVVNLFNSGTGILQDDNNHSTHFTGWLVEQDL